MKNVLYLLCLLPAGLQLPAKTTAYPSSITVALDGSGDYTTIQEAVNAVRDLSKQQVPPVKVVHAFYVN